MIEDLDGTTVEPARRAHVTALSAATAAVAVVLLVALVVPPTPVSVMPEGAPLPSPSASAGPGRTIVSGPTMFLRSSPPSFQSGATSPLGVNVKLVSECTDGSRIDAPYYLVFEGDGQVMAVPLEAGTTRSVPVDGGTGRLTVSCAASRDRVPRIDRGH